MKLKLFIATIAIVFVAGLGLVFTVERANTGDKSVADTSSGTVAGANSDSGSDYLGSLAKALAQKGVVLYGSYQSTDTKMQKDLFGDAASSLDYVECDASGPSANPDECISQQISTYPTWVYNGQQYTGVTQLSELAKLINFSQ